MYYALISSRSCREGRGPDLRAIFIGLLAAAFALAGMSGDAAQAAAVVGVKWMNCALHPGQLDIVYIENTGDAPQDLAGWELRSDRDSERMSLTPAGSLDPGEEIVASAGAHAVNLPNENVFLWSNDEMLRDEGEPPDYVWLHDASGARVSGMDCNHNLLAVAAPDPEDPPASQPEAAAQPTGAPSGPGASRSSGGTSGPRTAGASVAPQSIPVGGGPPAAPGGAAASWLALGVVLAVGGLGLAFAGGRKR